MKTKKDRSKSGISLIVLVITIIVIIILAVAVILTLNNNNPIAEANRARYESDVANMQAIFTNTVAKVMAQNQGTIVVNAGELNNVKVAENGVNSAEGRVNYIVNNPQDSSNTNGTIVFNSGTNNATTYYTGRMLPLYSSEETIWYVDSEGVISLKVGKLEYGNGDKIETPVEEKEITILDSDNPIMKKIQLVSFDAYPRKIKKIKFMSADKVSKEKEKLTDISQSQDKSVMAWLEDSGNTLILASKKGKIFANSDSPSLFYDLGELTEIENLQFLDVSQMITMENMFSKCTNLLTLDLSSFDTSNVTRMKCMFYNCRNLEQLNLGDKFDTSNVIDMSRMFEKCFNLESLDLKNKFNTQKVILMEYMFNDCRNMSILNLGNNFDTSNVTDMNYMFGTCCSLNKLELGEKFNTDKVKNMGSMFESCANLTTLGENIEFNIYEGSVGYMFSNCQKLTATINIKSINFCDRMFSSAATIEPAKITINYSLDTYFNKAFATKSENSNIVKGRVLQ